MNFPNIKVSYAGSGESINGTQIGYHVGVIVDIPLYRNYFYIQPGLYLTQKGYKNYGKYDSDSANPTYLEIPILLSGRYTFNFVQVQVNFGPYLACGLFGHLKDETSDLETYKYNYFGDNEYFSDAEYARSNVSRFDVGLSFGLGVLFLKHYYLDFQCEWGLYNTLTKLSRGDHSASIKNQNWMLCIGYNF